MCGYGELRSAIGNLPKLSKLENDEIRKSVYNSFRRADINGTENRESSAGCVSTWDPCFAFRKHDLISTIFSLSHLKLAESKLCSVNIN